MQGKIENKKLKKKMDNTNMEHRHPRTSGNV